MSCFPLTVMRPGSPGPAPTRKTFPSLKTQSFCCLTRRRAKRRARLRFLGREPHALGPLGVFNRRDLGRFYLAAATPEDVGVENRNPRFLEMLVDGQLVREHEIFVRTMRHGHDVHITKLRPALAPVCVGENVMPAHLPSRLDLSPSWYTPMKQCVVSRDTFTGRGRFDVLQERRESSDHFTGAERSGDANEFLARESGFRRATATW